MNCYSDAQLLLLLENDPQRGLTALLDAYGGVINRIIHRILGQHPQDAEECVADTLVAVWKNATALRAVPRPLKGWLCLTARNLAIDRWRSVVRQGTEELPEQLAGDWLLEPHTTEAEDRIEQMVLALPQPDREIFIRRYYLLESAAEIGAALNMAAHNVNVRLCRGRAKLKTQLLQEKGATNVC